METNSIAIVQKTKGIKEDDVVMFRIMKIQRFATEQLLLMLKVTSQQKVTTTRKRMTTL